MGARTARGALLGLALALVMSLGACAAPAGSVGTPDLTKPGILSRRQVDGRMWDLVVNSPALGRAVTVRLLLPVRFDAEPTRRWPVLWLLHGCCDDVVSWTRSTDVAALTREADLLVVMPDGGDVGFYSDWKSGPAWETFHTVELPALLADAYRAGTPEAIGGVSMGGLGALDYAAHQPGRFAVAISISGVVHTRRTFVVSRDYEDLVRSRSGGDPNALWGDPVDDAAVWARHNPFDLADALRGTHVFLASGNGHPGPLDPPGAWDDSTETELGVENQDFADRLRAVGVDTQFDLYGAGTHKWVYWQRELHRAWPLIVTQLGL